MNLLTINLLPEHRAVTERFITVCQEDERVVAAFLGGSYAAGTADAYSDLDLYLVTTEAAYEEFLAGKDHFIRSLGKPLLLTDFSMPDMNFFILANGTEGELFIGRAGDFQHIHGGPYIVLVDKQDLLNGVTFSHYKADPADQLEALQKLILEFWHEVSHFSAAIGRKQLWFAAGQIEALRRICVNLARLHYNFSDPGVGDEPYFKIEGDLPVERLAPLYETFVPVEYEALLRAGRILLQFYKKVAANMAEKFAIPYPAELERIISDRLPRE